MSSSEFLHVVALMVSSFSFRCHCRSRRRGVNKQSLFPLLLRLVPAAGTCNLPHTPFANIPACEMMPIEFTPTLCIVPTLLHEHANSNRRHKRLHHPHQQQLHEQRVTS